MQLEPFSADDAGTIAGWTTSVEEALDWCGLDIVMADTVVHWNEPDDVEGVMASGADGLAAYGEMWVDDEEGEVELAHLIVRPDLRGRNVGRRFVADLAASARRRHDVVVLRVVPHNERAIRCYAAAGFRRASSRDEADWNRGQPRDYVWMLFDPD